MIVDFEWYRSFSAIYRLGTVTAAAQERGLTQPAVTQHLAALEAATGEPLFARTPRRMLPTERGKLLYTSLAPALEALEQATGRLKRQAQQRPALRLGSPREFFSARVLPLLGGAPFRTRAQFGQARPLLAGLARGELDLVVASERLAMPEIDYRRLGEERFVLVGAAGLAPPGDEAALAGWLSEQTWLSYGADLPIIRRFWRQRFGRRPAIEPELILPDLLLIRDAARAGMGVSALPAYLCAAELAEGSLRLLAPAEPPVTNTLWLAQRSADRHRPELQQAAALLQGAADAI